MSEKRIGTMTTKNLVTVEMAHAGVLADTSFVRAVLNNLLVDEKGRSKLKGKVFASVSVAYSNPEGSWEGGNPFLRDFALTEIDDLLKFEETIKKFPGVVDVRLCKTYWVREGSPDPRGFDWELEVGS